MPGSHTVCAIVDQPFLDFSLQAGNDLSTPRPEWGFEGLSPGDRWRLLRRALAGSPPRRLRPEVALAATHARALEVVPIELLIAAAGDGDGELLREWFNAPMARALEADYLVVGAGASGMAFADALTQHSDARVALVDRRHGPGGHWLDAYPFVRLHQAVLVLRRGFDGAGLWGCATRGPRGRTARAGHGGGDLQLLPAGAEERLLPSGQVSCTPTASTWGVASSSAPVR